MKKFLLVLFLPVTMCLVLAYGLLTVILQIVLSIYDMTVNFNVEKKGEVKNGLV